MDGADGQRGRQLKRNNMVEGQLEMIFMPASSLPGEDTSTAARQGRRERYKGGEAGHD